MKKPWIVGNWKMHKTLAESAAFVEQMSSLHDYRRLGVHVALAPSHVALAMLHNPCQSLGIQLVSQNHHQQPQGAFTGEIAAEMVAAAGASLALVGHSERRQLFGETIAITHAKMVAALRAGLVPILCVGETLAEREQHVTTSVLQTQLRGALDNLPNLSQLLVAYEPVWAIGSGVAATPQDAQSALALVRQTLHSLDSALESNTTLLYGGSVNHQNAAELLAQPDIDGLLIGGASLDVQRFAQIVHLTSLET